MTETLKRRLRCSVYTRKSTDECMDQEYNSIDAQRDAGHAYIASQRGRGEAGPPHLPALRRNGLGHVAGSRN